MRSVPAGSFQRLSDPVSLWQAWTRCRKDRRRRPDIAAWDQDADLAVLGLSRALRAGCWAPGSVRARLVRDPKPRVVSVAPIESRVVEQALVTELAPTWQVGFLDQSFATGLGRGPQRAALFALQGQRRHRYRLALDVAGYFPTIDHAILRGLYARRLRDPRTLGLLDTLFTAGATVYALPWVEARLGPARAGVGLPVGSYLSHFSGALYLDALDQRVKRALKVPHYGRYMDDLLLFDDDDARLEDAGADIAAWLASERGQRFKEGAAVVGTDTTLDWLGHRISRAGISAGPKLWRNLRRRVRWAARRGPVALERTLAAYKGLLVW